MARVVADGGLQGVDVVGAPLQRLVEHGAGLRVTALLIQHQAEQAEGSDIPGAGGQSPPAPTLGFGPALLEVKQAGVSERQVMPARVVGGIEPSGPIQRRAGVRVTPLALQRLRQRETGLEMGRIALDRHPRRLFGKLMPLQAHQGHRPVDQDDGAAGLTFQRPVEIPQRLFPVPLLPGQRAEIAQDLGLVRRDFENPGVGGLGLGDPLALLQRRPKVDPGSGVARCEGGGALQQLDRRFEPTRPPPDVPQGHHGADAVRLLGERFFQSVDRAGKIP